MGLPEQITDELRSRKGYLSCIIADMEQMIDELARKRMAAILEKADIDAILLKMDRRPKITPIRRVS